MASVYLSIPDGGVPLSPLVFMSARYMAKLAPFAGEIR